MIISAGDAGRRLDLVASFLQLQEREELFGPVVSLVFGVDALGREA